MNFLERMKHKQEHVKGRIAFVAAFSITMVIALVWSVSLPARFASVAKSNESIQVTEDTALLDNVIQDSELQLGNVVETINPYADLETFGKSNEVNQGAGEGGTPSQNQEAPATILVVPTPASSPIETTPEATPKKQGPPNIIFKEKSTTSPISTPEAKPSQNP